jgi:hypothetical protein
MRRTLLLAVALSVAAAWPAAAQNLKVEFHEGRVSVEASAVPVRTILTEWGKIGGTKIVGADRISGAPITVKLINVTEAQALETILRSVAGYMAAPRNSGDGLSKYDRIMVMATSSTPPPVAATRPPQQPSTAAGGTQRFIPPRQRPEQAEAQEQEEPDENPPNPPVFTFPQPQQGQNGFVNQPGQFVNPPAQFQNTPQNGAFNPGTAPNTAQPAPTQPQVPIGVSQPGMMVQPPPQQQPSTTRPATPGMIRPPGNDRN